MSMTSESDERMMPNNGVDSPSTDDANSGANAGNNGPLKKGPWTSAEDAILVEYVTKHGEGNWNAVQKHSGLARCGKSCRLRWANHLRPDLKKGAFTPDEERRIIELHAKMGNKWARMAAELPGRTDNEIKNFWNTRIKRRQRAGLPIYPPDICLQASNENQQSGGDTNTLDGPNPDFMPVNNFKIPSVEFKGLGFNRQFHPQALIDIPTGNNFPDIPSSSLLAQNFNPSYNNKSLLSSTFHQSKRLRGSEPLFPGLNAPMSQYQIDYSVQIAKSFIFSQYDHNSNYASPSSLFADSHVVLNANPSSELPSLQTQTGNGGSSPSPSSPLPFFESVDILIQTPPTEHASSSHLSNSGLLEEVLYESESLKNSNSTALQMENDMMRNSARVLNETKWEAYDEEVSPLGHSSSSVFSDSTPITPISGNSLDEPRSAENLPEVASNLDQLQYDDKVETANQVIFTRPDYLLASNCLGPMKHSTTNDHSLLENAMGKLLGDDLSRDCKQMDTGASSSGQGRRSDSCAWNAMPTV